MITKLYEQIAEGLRAVRPCQVYAWDIPQETARPFFLVTLAGLKPEKGINGRLKHTVTADVSYYPESRTEPSGECWQTGQDLAREFAADGFRIKNKNLKLTEGVLHVTFDVEYREYRETSPAAMQNLAQNTELKEDS